MKKLKADDNLYVKKSVDNVLRNASRNDPNFVVNLYKKWVRLKNPHTNWIIKEGLRKLKETNEKEASEILNLINQ